MRASNKIPRKATRSDAGSLAPRSRLPSPLLVLCLCILALRVTYTEAPTVQTTTLASSLMDTVYSLTLSGLLVFACVVWLVHRLATSRLAHRVTAMEVGWLLFVVAATIASFAASDKRTAINHAAILLAPPFAALALARILNNRERVRLVLIVVAALGIVSAYQCAEQLFLSNAITIEQYEKDPNLLLAPLGIETGTFPHFLFEHRLYSRGIRGFFTTSNSAASFGICASFAAIALLIARLESFKSRKEGRRYVVFTLLATLLIVAGLLSTQSKGGIAAFVAGLLVFALLLVLDRWFASSKRRILAFLIPAALLAVVAVACVAVHYGLKHGRLPGGNSMLVRWQYWVASAQMYEDHPITGVGPGNFSDYYPHYKPPAALESVADPHNWLLSLVTQYGPLGLVAFLVMLCGPLWRWLRPASAAPLAEAAPGRPVGRESILGLLLLLSSCLLFIRPLLIPTSGTGEFDLWLYEVITLFVGPAAVFLIGFLLVAAPFEQPEATESESRLSRSVLYASLSGAIVAVLLHNLIDFAIFEPGVWTVFWVFLACLVGLHSHRIGPWSAVLSRSRRIAWVAAIAASTLLAAYIFCIWAPAYRTTVGIGRSQRATSYGRFSLAHDVLVKAQAADRFSPSAANFNGRLYLQQFEQMSPKQTSVLEDAANCFREAIARNPADYKNYEKLAVVYDRLGRPRDAYDWYLKAARFYPGCDRLWFEMGRLAEALRQPEAALDHYTKAVEIEDAYRRQFQMMYPDRKRVVSRLGESQYGLAQERIARLRRLDSKPGELTPTPPQ